jgi:hypothetical protein
MPPSANWVDQISEEELNELLPEAARAITDTDAAATLIQEEQSFFIAYVDDIDTDLYAYRPHQDKKRPKIPIRVKGDINPKLWPSVKGEFYALVCTDDHKYANTRKDLAKVSGPATVVIVSTIAAAVAASVGVIPGAITGLIVVLLRALLLVGKNAACKSFAPPKVP